MASSSPIEQRARKVIRSLSLTPSSTILVITDDTCESSVTNYLVKKLLTFPKVEFSKGEKKGFDHTIVPLSADDKAENLLDHFLSSADLTSGTSLLQESTQSEIQAFARAKKLPCNEKSYKNVEKFTKIQPSASQALAKSSVHIENSSKNKK